MKKILPVFFLAVFLLCTQSGVHENPPTPTLTPTPTATPVPNAELVALIMSMIRHESPVRLENGAWGYLETDEDSHYVFVWRGNFLLSEMLVRRIIAAWIAFEEQEECDLGIRFGPAWSMEGKPGPDIDQSYFGLYIRTGDEEVFFKMLRIQPPHLQDC